MSGLGKISRQVEAATGQMGMVNDLTLYFGLGNYSDSTVDLEIFWPDGSVQFVTGAAKNQLVKIRIPEPATLGTLLLGGSALLRRRRKSSATL